MHPHRRLLSPIVGLALIAAVLQMLVSVVACEIIDSVVKQKDYGRLYPLTGGLFALQVGALGAALAQASIATAVAVNMDRELLSQIDARVGERRREQVGRDFGEAKDSPATSRIPGVHPRLMLHTRARAGPCFRRRVTVPGRTDKRALASTD